MGEARRRRRAGKGPRDPYGAEPGALEPPWWYWTIRPIKGSVWFGSVDEFLHAGRVRQPRGLLRVAALVGALGGVSAVDSWGP